MVLELLGVILGLVPELSVDASKSGMDAIYNETIEGVCV